MWEVFIDFLRVTSIAMHLQLNDWARSDSCIGQERHGPDIYSCFGVYICSRQSGRTPNTVYVGYMF